ncbi:MAG: xylulokinase, partial [Alphaproteobacteria bacterium]
VDLPEEGDFGGAFGAARMGLIAAENADPAAICTRPPVAGSVAPDPALAGAFDAAHARYRAAYTAIREL